MLMLMKRELCTAYYQAYLMLEDGLEAAMTSGSFSVEERDVLIRSVHAAIAHISIEHNKLALAGTPFAPREEKAGVRMSHWTPLHFFSTDIPYKDGTPISATCDEWMPNPVAVAIWEFGKPVKGLRQTSLFCKNCCLAPDPRGRYLYALMDRDEAIRRGLIGEAAEVLS
jgi:hypothetical protein